MALKDYNTIELLNQLARDRYTLEEVIKMYTEVLEKRKHGFIYWPDRDTGIYGWVKASTTTR